MIAKVSTAMTLDLGVGQVTEHPNAHGRPWFMRATQVEITYFWCRPPGYWRVESSRITGTPISGPCPDEYTYLRHDRAKPLWLVALEHRYYPRSMDQWNGSTNVVLSNS